jgi:hypothetical protein
MTKLILFLALFTTVGCYGQTTGYSESEIYSLFKKSISQTEKDKIEIPSNPWLICNQDSSFYYKDTIKICSNSYYRNSLNCCQYIAWTFYDKDKFISTNLELCKEPTTASVTKDKDYFKILVVPADNYLIISTFNNDKLKDSFKLLSVDKIKQSNSDLISTVLTMVRQKQ